MDPLDRSEHLENLLAGYVLGDLTPEEVAEVKQLLENNPELLAEVDQLQSTLALLPLSLPSDALPPQHLQSKILQAAQTDAPGNVIPLQRTARRMGTRPWKWAIVMGSSAALASVVFGIQTYQLQQRLADAQTKNRQLQQELIAAQNSLAQLRQTGAVATTQDLSRYQQVVDLMRKPNNRFLSLKSIRPNSSSSGSLLIVPKSDAAILALQNVPPLPPEKVYRMWAIVNGKKLSCTDFKPNDRGEVFLEVPLDRLGAATEVVVTVEPDRQMPQPVGEMVIVGS